MFTFAKLNLNSLAGTL